MQQGFYDYGIKAFRDTHPELEGYKVEPMRFVFIDSTGFNKSVILETSKDDVERAWRGFTVRSYKYPGIKSLLESLQWSIDTGNWTTTKELYDNKGIHKMKIPYGSR